MAVTTPGVAIANLGVNTREWVAGLSKAQKGWVSFGATLQVTGFRIGAVWAATIGAMMLGVAKFGSSFEQEFVGIKKTITATTKQFATLKTSLLETAKATGMSADQLAILARKGGQLGVGIENIQKFTEVIAKLSIAAVELDPEAAATGLARLITITGRSMSDIDQYASVLARLGDSFATTEGRILNFSERIAGLAKVTGMGAEGALALGAAFTATVPGVELVATQLSKGMGIMANAVATGGKKLEALNELVKHTGTTFSTIFKVDAPTAIAEFLRGLDNVQTAGGNVWATLRELGLTNQRAAQAFLSAAGSAEKFKDAIRDTRDEIELVNAGGGKLEDVFAEQMQMVSAKWGQLWEGIRVAAIKFFDAFADEVAGWIDWAKEMIHYAEVIADNFATWPTWAKQITLGLSGAGGALSALLLGMGMLVSVFGTVKPVLKAIKTLLFGQAAAMTAANASTVVGVGQMELFGKAAATASKGLILLRAGLGIAAGLAFIIWMFKAMYDEAKILNTVIPKTVDRLDELNESMEMLRKQEHFLKQKGSALTGMTSAREQKALRDVRDRIKEVGTAIMRLQDRMEKTQPLFDKVKKSLDYAEATKGMTDHMKLMVDAYMAVGWKLEEATDRVAKRFIQSAGEMDDAVDEAAAKHKAAVEGLIGIGKKMLDEMFPLKSLQDRMRDWNEEIKRGIEEGMASQEFFTGPRLPTGIPGGVGGPDMPGGLSLWDRIGGGLSGMPGTLDAVQERAKKADDAMKQFRKTLADANRIASLFGGTLGNVVGQALSAVGALASLGELGAISQAGGGMGGIFGGTMEAFSAASDKAGGGIMGALSGGLAAAGPWAAVAMTAFNVFKAVFAKEERWEYIARTSADIFGKAFSEELAKKIEAAEKAGLSFGEALAQNIGSIVEEVGVNVENFEAIWGSFFVALDNGLATTEELGKAFVGLKDHLQTLGEEGSLQIGELVRRMREAGVVTEELTAHLKEQAGMLIDNLAPALDYIINLEDMTAEEATAMSGVIVASWAAAVASTGSFIEAVRMLGDKFGEAIAKIQEVLGPEGSKLIGPIVGIYNVISNNQEAFDALYGIVGGLDQMAQMGILTKESLMAMGEAARVTFERILAETNDQNAALRAAWPELIKLYDWYKKLGLEVPPWLQENIDLGKDMGLSMDVPMSTEQALNRMVEILEQIAIKLGAVAVEAENAGTAIANMPMPGEGLPDSSPGGGGPRGEGMQHGTPEEGVLFNQPTMLQVAEVRPERVWVENEGEGRMGGSDVSIGAINIEVSGAQGPEQTVKHIEANLEQSMTRIFRRAKQAGHV